MATQGPKPTKHDLDWALVAEAIRGDTYELLSGRAKEQLLRETWAHTDAYGSVGLTPPQGWDWSGIRDSSPEAIAKIAAAARRVLKQQGIVIPRAALVAKATESLARRAEVEAAMPELSEYARGRVQDARAGAGAPIPGFGASATPAERAEGDKIAAQNQAYWATRSDGSRIAVTVPDDEPAAPSPEETLAGERRRVRALLVRRMNTAADTGNGAVVLALRALLAEIEKG